MKKFTLAWALSVVALLCMAAMTFFSRYFAELGKMGFGILFGVVIIVLFFFFVFMLARLKQAEIPYNFKKTSSMELLFIVLFAAVVFLNVMLSNHFFVVFGKQEEIKKEVVNQIDQIDEMFKSYNDNVEERTKAYEAYLNSLEPGTADYTSAGLSEYSKETLIVNFNAKLDCGDVETEVDKWKKEMKSKTEGLGLITLMPRTQEINKVLEETRDNLVELDRKSDEGINDTERWNFELTEGEDLLAKFAAAPKEQINLWAIVCNIVLALIVLLPYIAANRDGRHKGIFWEMTHDRESNGGANSGVIGF